MKPVVPAERRWEKTRLQNLVRNSASGRYYARLYRDGKEVWKSLKTAHFSVAEARLAAAINEHRQSAGIPVDASSAKMTFGEAAALCLGREAKNVEIKRRTKAYRIEVHAALLRSWPGLDELPLRRITPSVCRDWAISFSKRFSATRYNGTLSHLRRVFEIGVENGILHTNPSAGLKRRGVKSKQLQLPTRAQFADFIAAMRAGNSRDSNHCADLAQGLAFTGCRISEAARVTWRDLDFHHNEIVIRGDPEEATKNGEIRRVPMIPSARSLFDRLKSQRLHDEAGDAVFSVRECQQSMNRAAKVVNMTRITHHDLRHFFATICLEGGVDIPTVSRWLGHKDGGALAMRTYGHLRREHSVAQAQKVSFEPTTNAIP